MRFIAVGSAGRDPLARRVEGGARHGRPRGLRRLGRPLASPNRGLVLIVVGTGAGYAFYKGGVLAGCLLALLGLLLKQRGAAPPSTDRQNAVRSLPLFLLVACISGGCATSPAAVSPAGSSAAQPPVYAEKEKAAAAASSSAAAAPAAEKSVDATAASPTAGLSRSTSTASHFHGSPGGSAVQEKS